MGSDISGVMAFPDQEPKPIDNSQVKRRCYWVTRGPDAEADIILAACQYRFSGLYLKTFRCAHPDQRSNEGECPQWNKIYPK